VFTIFDKPKVQPHCHRKTNMSSVLGVDLVLGAGAGAGAGSGSGTSSDSDHKHVIDVEDAHPSETGTSSAAPTATGAAAGTSEDIVGDPAPLPSELPCPPSEPFPDAVPARLARDPEALECPYEACTYDCQRHHPVRSPCCNRLMCFKCAGVLATLPNATPCTLCGKAASGPFEASQFQRDVGLLLALATTVPPPDRCVCAPIRLGPVGGARQGLGGGGVCGPYFVPAVSCRVNVAFSPWASLADPPFTPSGFVLQPSLPTLG
jgi:hypothetical protein